MDPALQELIFSLDYKTCLWITDTLGSYCQENITIQFLPLKVWQVILLNTYNATFKDVETNADMNTSQFHFYVSNCTLQTTCFYQENLFWLNLPCRLVEICCTLAPSWGILAPDRAKQLEPLLYLCLRIKSLFFFFVFFCSRELWSGFAKRELVLNKGFPGRVELSRREN